MINFRDSKARRKGVLSSRILWKRQFSLLWGLVGFPLFWPQLLETCSLSNLEREVVKWTPPCLFFFFSTGIIGFYFIRALSQILWPFSDTSHVVVGVYAGKRIIFRTRLCWIFYRSKRIISILHFFQVLLFCFLPRYVRLPITQALLHVVACLPPRGNCWFRFFKNLTPSDFPPVFFAWYSP